MRLIHTETPVQCIRANMKAFVLNQVLSYFLRLLLIQCRVGFVGFDGLYVDEYFGQVSEFRI